MPRRRSIRKKFCPFKSDPKQAGAISYKNPDFLKRFLGENGKLMPSRISGVSSYYQRILAREIKRARHLALLPYSTADQLLTRSSQSRHSRY